MEGFLLLQASMSILSKPVTQLHLMEGNCVCFASSFLLLLAAPVYSFGVVALF